MKNPPSNGINGQLLNRAVLVLNANYTPMSICTAQRAICMYVLEKIEVLVIYREQVHSPSITMDLPSVVKIHDYVRYDNMAIEINRKNILARDEYICQYCNTTNGPLTIDHIIPKVHGGLDIWENLVAACKPCNQKKGDRTLENAKMPLIRIPKRPNRIHYFQRFVKDLQRDWRPYLFMESF